MNLNLSLGVILSVLFYLSLKTSMAADMGSFNSKSLQLQKVNATHSLYDQIRGELSSEFENIGNSIANDTLGSNDADPILGMNHAGIRYHHKFSTFNIHARRNLAPDLFDDKRWIITDEFTIDIDAKKLLNQLKEGGEVDIDEREFAAFLGLRFKRQYRSVHFADSYREGLFKRFDLLFMPFNQFQYKGLFNLLPEEMIQREDFISFKGGAVGQMPIYPSLALRGGVLGKFEKISKIGLSGVGKKNSFKL